jgi:hypothetical protein
MRRQEDVASIRKLPTLLNPSGRLHTAAGHGTFFNIGTHCIAFFGHQPNRRSLALSSSLVHLDLCRFYGVRALADQGREILKIWMPYAIPKRYPKGSFSWSLASHFHILILADRHLGGGSTLELTRDRILERTEYLTTMDENCRHFRRTYH